MIYQFTGLLFEQIGEKRDKKWKERKGKNHGVGVKLQKMEWEGQWATYLRAINDYDGINVENGSRPLHLAGFIFLMGPCYPWRSQKCRILEHMPSKQQEAQTGSSQLVPCICWFFSPHSSLHKIYTLKMYFLITLSSNGFFYSYW